VSEQVEPIELIRRIAILTRELDGDLRALGPHLDSAVQTKLTEACRLMLEAGETARAQGEPYVAEQMTRLGLDRTSRNLKVQLGGGAQEVEGWLNVDFQPAQLALNARWGLPFGDGACQYIYSSHMLEHFFFRFESIPLLKEIHRVLAPDGVLRIIVPDIGKCLDAYNRKDKQFFEDRKKVWPWAASCRSHLEHFLEYAGANQFDVSFMSHKYGYDYDTLQASLREAGFTHVVRSYYMGSSHAELNLDHISPFASATSGGASYSLFAEATH
jgi:predicted SAM-dependent methyltransferase